jgi:ribosomal protein L28
MDRLTGEKTAHVRAKSHRMGNTKKNQLAEGFIQYRKE